MSRAHDDEPLFPPWIVTSAKIIAPLALLGLIYWVLTSVARIPGNILIPVLAVLALATVIYFGGRYYKPFHYDKAAGRCGARGAKQRMSCRHFIPGARLGGGCGRQREDGRCRYVHG